MYMPQYGGQVCNYYTPNHYHPGYLAPRMSFFGIGNQGITLKELLEDPKLQNPPPVNSDGKFDKLKGGSSPGGFDFSSAFLGPNIWGNTGGDGDINLEYMDLDEFLSENGIPIDLEDNSNEGKSSVNLKVRSPRPLISSSPVHSAEESCDRSVNVEEFLNSPDSSTQPALSEHLSDSPPCTPDNRSSSSSPAVELEFDVSEQDLALSSAPGVFRYGDFDFSARSPPVSETSRASTESCDGPLDPNVKAEFVGQDFDPKKRRFTEEELRPQPMIKKSRKVFVPDDCKDDKYWQRRKKNNIAAKRSRDARRIKENQIALRASFLERQSEMLRIELEKVKKENQKLRAQLEKYEDGKKS